MLTLHVVNIEFTSGQYLRKTKKKCKLNQISQSLHKVKLVYQKRLFKAPGKEDQ